MARAAQSVARFAFRMRAMQRATDPGFTTLILYQLDRTNSGSRIRRGCGATLNGAPVREPRALALFQQTAIFLGEQLLLCLCIMSVRRLDQTEYSL